MRSAKGAASPTTLFLGGLDNADLNWTRLLSERARAAGFTRAIEPCCGSFVVSCAHRYAGWRPDQIEASDVSLFSAICGAVITGRDLAELQYRKDGELLALTGDPLHDAARMLFEQCLARLQKRSGYYWEELATDLQLRHDAHVEKIQSKLAGLRDHLRGISFRPLCVFRHLDEVKDDPRAFVHLSPPTYLRGYEKLYDTGGRITWAEPAYDVFDPNTSQKKLAEESRSWPCLLVCLQEDPPGKSQETCVYARSVGRDRCLYFWTNKPDVLQELMGKLAVPRRDLLGAPVKLPVISPTDPITQDAELKFVVLSAAQTAHYKDLWIHKIDAKPASVNLGLLINGKLAGIMGYGQSASQTLCFASHGNAKYPYGLLLTYATGAPHPTRLTRLLTMLAMNRCMVDAFIAPWFAVQVKQLLTVEFTNRSESKQNRGIMKLAERVPDKKYGQKLVYVADVVERSLTDTLRLWLAKEQQWTNAKSAQGPRAKRSRPSNRSSSSTSATTCGS
jgi:hypothetical protein